MARELVGPAPTAPAHAATKAYVDAKVLEATGGGLTESALVSLVEDTGSDIRTTLDGLYEGGGSTPPAWGEITGTLADQADLQAALDAKATDTAVVHSTGDEEVHGDKTFTGVTRTRADHARVEIENTATTQFSTAGFRVYNDAATLTDKAGIQVQAGIADEGATEAYAEITWVDRDGNWVAPILGFQPDGYVIANGPLYMSTHRVEGVAPATAGDHAVNKDQLDAVAAVANTAVQPGSLSTVAATGSYTDLTNKPTIPDALADLDTTVTGSQLNDLKTTVDGLATVAATGDYADLLGTPAIPTALTDLDTTVTGTALDAMKTKLDGIAAGATANSPDATLLARANHTGTQSADTITDGTTNKAYTAAEKSKLASIASGADVTDATNVAAAGAVMDTDTSVAGFGFVLDQADLASNSATKLPTQASVKSYVDTGLAGKAAAVHTHTLAALTDVTASATEVNYLTGVTSAIQDQLDAKATALGYTPEDVANKGVANGYASLDSGGKVPVSQLPSAIMEYKGTWNAFSNTPTLADGVGDTGDLYRVSAAGTVDLGSGPIEFRTGDYAIYNGATWERSGTTDAVSSVSGRTGDITLTKVDVGLTEVDNTADLDKPVSTATAAALAGKLSAARTITAGTGLSGGGDLTTDRTLAVAFGTSSTTVCAGNDSRLSDARTPTAHTHSADDLTSGILDIARIPVGATDTTVCIGDDSRLSDARTPTAHTHDAADINVGTLAIGRIPTGTTSSTVCIGNDARLSDTRTPTDTSVTTAKLANGAVSLAKCDTGVVASLTKADGSVQKSGSASGLWVGSTLPGSGTTGVLYVVTP